MLSVARYAETVVSYLPQDAFDFFEDRNLLSALLWQLAKTRRPAGRSGGAALQPTLRGKKRLKSSDLFLLALVGSGRHGATIGRHRLLEVV